MTAKNSRIGISTFFILWKCNENPPAGQAREGHRSSASVRRRYLTILTVTFSAVASFPVKVSDRRDALKLPDSVICLLLNVT